MGEKYTSLIENGTRELVHLPPGASPLKGNGSSSFNAGLMARYLGTKLAGVHEASSSA